MANGKNATTIAGHAITLFGDARETYISTECGGDSGLEAAVRAQIGSPSSEHYDQEFPNYTVLRRIGAGGMGSVLLAEEIGELKRTVAIKVIHPQFSSPDLIARFHAERHVLAQLKHRNIAAVHGTGESRSGLPFFAMEYVPGTTIEAYCDEQRLSIPDRLRLYAQVCAGVHHAHQKGVIHRDIKPSNVLVHEVDGRPEVKIIDFGIAKLEEKMRPADHRETAVGTLLGTKQYMSPEQASRQPEAIDVRSDIYSLGAMLFEILVGKPPFDGRILGNKSDEELESYFRNTTPPTPTEKLGELKPMLAQIAEARKTTPETLRRSLSRELSWILGKCLAKNPDERYPSVSGFAVDLVRYLQHEPVMAAPPSRAYRASKFIRRHRLAVAASLVLTAVLLAGLAGTTVGLLRAQQAEAQALQEAETARQVIRFLTDLFEVSDPEEGEGKRITARELLDRGGQSIASELSDQPGVRAPMMRAIGDIYRKLGLYEQAEPLLLEAVDIYRSGPGTRPEDLAQGLNSLGVLYLQMARFDQAERAVGEALELRRQVLGSSHPEVARSLLALAQLKAELGEYQPAAELHEQALAMRRSALGSEHKEVASSLNELAGVYAHLGRYEDSERLYSEALAMQETIRGHDHPDVGLTLANLGALYKDLARYDEAEQIFVRSLDIFSRALEPSHPHVAAGHNNLASVYLEQSRFEEAEARFQQAMALREHALGVEHPRYADTLHNLGIVYSQWGKLDEAETMFLHALNVRRKVLEPNHVAISQSLNSLAIVARQKGDYEGAKELLVQSLAVRQAALGADHPDVARVLMNLGTVVFTQGDIQGALGYFQRAQEISERALGEDHPTVAGQLFNMAEINKYLEQYEEAERLHLRALEIYQRLHDPDHLDVAESRYAVGIVKGYQGHHQDADVLFEQAIGTMTRTLGADNPRLASYFANQAEMYLSQALFERAGQKFSDALAILEQSVEPDHPELGTALLGLGEAQAGQGLVQAAEASLLRSRPILQDALGAEHANTVRLLLALANLYRDAGRLADAAPLYAELLALPEGVRPDSLAEHYQRFQATDPDR